MGSITMYYGDFINVNSKGNGGAIYAEDVHWKLQYGSFENGSAVQGGFIYLNGGSLINSQTPMTRASAGVGGCVMLVNISRIYFELGNFEYCEASGYGGGAYISVPVGSNVTANIAP